MAGIETRVGRAAESALARQGFVTPIDVLIGVGWLTAVAVENWQRGRPGTLESVIQVGPEKVDVALKALRRWAENSGLRPHEAAYPARSRTPTELRFTATGDPLLERVYRTHWLSPDLPEPERKALAEKQATPPDLVVISPLKDWTCSDCGQAQARGELLLKEGDDALCLACADLGHLVFLPSGDATLTRRAKKASTLFAVVVRFAGARGRYERQGLLVEEGALEQAEQSCLADEEVRTRRRERERERRERQDEAFVTDLGAEIRRLFPGCPPKRAAAIAAWTGTRGSGRVGRSAAGRAFDPGAVEAAVVASVRHEDTPYDDLLMGGIPRAEARAAVRAAVDEVMDGWRAQS